MARRLVPLGLLIAALAAAGCGSAQSVTSQQQRSTPVKTTNFVELAAKSAARTQAAGSAHISMAIAMHVAGSDQGFAMNGSGDVSYKPRAASMTMKIASGVPQMNGTMREVMIGTRMYMNWPLLSAQIPGHKPWIEEDLGAIGSAMGMNLSGMMNQGSSNPSQMLSYLRGVAAMKQVGHATIAGVATTEYSGTIDYTKLVGKGLITQKALNLIRTELGGTTVPFKIWLDGSHMLRQMQMTMQMTTPNGGPTMVMRMQFQMSKFGEKVHIAAPPASQVFDATKLAMSGLGSASGSGSSS